MRRAPLLGLLLLAAPAAAQDTPEASSIGAWQVRCHRAGAPAGRAFEICNTRGDFAGGPIALDRQADGIIGYIDDCPGAGKGSVRLTAHTLARPKDRAARLGKAIADAYRGCRLPAPALVAADLEALLSATDGLAAGWVRDPDLQRLRQPQ